MEDQPGHGPLVEVAHLSRSFGSKRVLRDLSLVLRRGERVALRGPNGAGKTTLLRCILGTLAPSDGVVTVGGHRGGTRAARALVGASLAQERSFYLRLTALDNLLLFAGLRGMSQSAARREVASLVNELGLHEIAGQRADSCSTGQLQRVAFARALLGSPRVLLLDEPTRSLDADARDGLWAAIHRRPDAAVLFATHLDEDANRASRLLDLHPE